MRRWGITSVLSVVLCLASGAYGSDQKRLFVVSSYHKEYQWSQQTHDGFCQAMLQHGYFDNKDQIAEYTKNDYAETSKMILKKLWMDSKRKAGNAEKEEMSLMIYGAAKEFRPDLILLGDDNATQYIGKKFLDTDIPIVFWGVNNTPVKYGLLDSSEKPGHNVTGVYQTGYYIESLGLLRAIAPNVRKIAILSDETPTGRSHHKAINYLARKGSLPVQIVQTISTDDFEFWKEKALELQNRVDAFFIAHYAGLKDKLGSYMPPEQVAEWYGAHIHVPEVTGQRQFVSQGMLCAADDSAYNQGFEAGAMAHEILANGADPATMPPRTPKRGPLIVNKKRAKTLGIPLPNELAIDEYVE